MDTITPLFPTPFMHCPGLIDQDLLLSFNDDLAKEDWFKNVHTELLTHTQVVNPSSNKIFLKVRKLVMPKVVEFGSHLFGEKLNWFVKEMWINVMHKGGHQAVHSHANSFISGVIYFTPSHPSSSLVLHRNGGGGIDYVFNNENENTQMGPYNCAKWQCPPLGAGDMVLFPSYMLHSVPTNQGDKRVSLAFNALPETLDSWGYKVKFTK